MASVRLQRGLCDPGGPRVVTYFREPFRDGDEALDEAREAGAGGVLFYWAMHRQPADQVIQDIVARGGVAAGREADLGDPPNIRLVFDECEAVLGPVDVRIQQPHPLRARHPRSRRSCGRRLRRRPDLGRQLGEYGITVNIVAPGPVQTGWLTPDQETAISAGTPLRRCGTPQDVADVMVFLASDQADSPGNSSM